MSFELSIVITSYNTRELLRRCLRSIQAEKGSLDLEIIVVDNASRDASAEMIRQTAPEANLIEPGHNTWATGGNNLGIAAATGDYTLLLNPDTVILPGTLQTTLTYLRQHPQVGAVSCKSYFPGHEDEGAQPTCSRFPRYLDLILDYTFLGLALSSFRRRRRAYMWYGDWKRDTSRSVEVIPGSYMMLPTPLLKSIDGYDRQIKLYYVEDDICKKVIDAGYDVYFLAEAVFLHEERASTSQVWRLASQIYFDDLIIFCRKYYGTPATILLQFLMTPMRWAMDIRQALRGDRRSLG
jgi:N-acetylglucosaminyl-diphospho-decaprenol L-rhamnosyltransferase